MDVAGELRVRIDPRFGTVTLPPRQRPPGAVEIRRPVGARSIFMVSRARSRARPRSVSCSAAVTSSLRMPDGVDVVHHHGGMAERRDQRAGIPAPGIQRGRADLGQPVARPGLKPAVTAALVRSATRSSSWPRSRSTRPVIHRVGAVGLPEERSSRPSRGPPPLQTSSAIPQRVPWPATARITVAQPTPRSRATAATAWVFLADPPTGLSAGSLGQHRPGTDRGRPLGPGAYPAGWRTTAPDPLAPGQHTGRPPTEQVAHPDRTAAVELGPRPSAPAPDRGGCGLDGEPPLAACDHRRRGPRSRPGRAAWSPTHSCGDPPGASCLADVTHPQARRGLRCCSGRSSIAGSSKPPQVS